MNRSQKVTKMTCQICGTTHAGSLRKAMFVRPGVAELVNLETGKWDEDGYICADDLQKFRHRYIKNLLETEKGELSEIENEVIESLRENEILSRNPDIEFEGRLTFGERLADRMAGFGGSWIFICIFAAILFAWVFINSYFIAAQPFDPYPYIFLNLILSCLAAVQAPVIMMSQNRQEARDQMRAMHDYQVNLKAELEIRHLHQKIDHLLSHQWERLVEIQEIQMELMSEIRGRSGK